MTLHSARALFCSGCFEGAHKETAHSALERGKTALCIFLQDPLDAKLCKIARQILKSKEKVGSSNCTSHISIRHRSHTSHRRKSYSQTPSANPPRRRGRMDVLADTLRQLRNSKEALQMHAAIRALCCVHLLQMLLTFGTWAGGSFG